MATRVLLPREQVFSNIGIVGAGYRLFFYETGTTTKKDTYSDEGLTTPNTNPVVADSAGRFGDIWISDASLYKCILAPEGTDDPPTNPIWTADPLNNNNSGNIIIFDPIPAAYWGTTSGTSTVYTLDPALVPIISYNNKQCFLIDFHIACGDAPTLSINNLSALNLKKKTGQGTKVSLRTGDLQVGRYLCYNDGTDIVVYNTRGEILYLGALNTITIQSDAITIPNNTNEYVIDTEGASATDDLSTINGGADGQLIILQCANDSRNVVIKHNVDNIFNPDGVDITLSFTKQKVVLNYNESANEWIVVSYPQLASNLYYESSEQTITSAGSLTLAHNLKINGVGVKPKNYKAYLVCKTAELGFSVGDETPVETWDRNDNGPGHGLVIVPDDTNLNIRFGSVVYAISQMQKDTGQESAITPANWKVIFRASINF